MGELYIGHGLKRDVRRVKSTVTCTREGKRGKRRVGVTKSWRERGEKGENGVNKGRDYTTCLVMSNRKSTCSGLTFQ